MRKDKLVWILKFSTHFSLLPSSTGTPNRVALQRKLVFVFLNNNIDFDSAAFKFTYAKEYIKLQGLDTT